MSIKSQEALQERIDKSLSHLKDELATIRAGKANPALVDRVIVDYYGTATPLKSLANISTPDPRTILIAPFDPKSISDIEKGINLADIGIPPVNDGKLIRLAIPQMTEERRKELTKTVKKIGEEIKVGIRNLRRDANEAFKKMEKAKELTEDDLHDELDKAQKATDEAMKEVDAIVGEKEKEILEV